MNQDEIYRGSVAVSKASNMKKIGQDESGWEVFFRDDRTGEHWVLDYPDSAQHGGGSPRLGRHPGGIAHP
jgi:hypothetical protein